LGTNSFNFWKDGQASPTLTFNGGWPATTNHPTLANYIEIGGRRDGNHIAPDSYQGGVGSNWSGDIAEVLMFTTTLSSVERTSVENYLIGKYLTGIGAGNASPSLTTSIPVTFTDVDLTDVGHTASITNVVASGITTGLTLDTPALLALVNTGTVTKVSGSTSGSTNLNFSAPASALDYLGEGQVLTLTYTVSVNDGDGGIDTEQVTINITGTNDVPTLTAFAAPVDTTNEDTVVEITLADLLAQGNEGYE